MALATPNVETVAGLVAAVTPRGASTEVTVRSPHGDEALVELPATPDGRAADRVEAAYRRMVWQRIDVDGGHVACRLRGVRHRLPTEQSISLGAALALAERGLPTVVRVEGR